MQIHGLKRSIRGFPLKLRTIYFFLRLSSTPLIPAETRDLPIRPSTPGLLSVVLLSVLWSLGVPYMVFAEHHLDYQQRCDQSGCNRYEGVKASPIKGEDLVLIAAMVDWQEQPSRLPTQPLKLNFFLQDENTDVDVTVREIDNQYFYVMDSVKPAVSWRKGFRNEFAWTTQTVLQELNKNMDMYELGVLAQEKTKEKSKTSDFDLKVAPAILYHTALPKTVEAYRFTFKPGEDARLTCTIARQGGKTTVLEQFIPHAVGGRPLSIRWDASKAGQGTYVLTVDGYSLFTGDPFQQKIAFYHHPTVRTVRP